MIKTPRLKRGATPTQAYDSGFRYAIMGPAGQMVSAHMTEDHAHRYLKAYLGSGPCRVVELAELIKERATKSAGRLPGRSRSAL